MSVFKGDLGLLNKEIYVVWFVFFSSEKTQKGWKQDLKDERNAST